MQCAFWCSDHAVTKYDVPQVRRDPGACVQPSGLAPLAGPQERGQCLEDGLRLHGLEALVV